MVDTTTTQCRFTRCSHNVHHNNFSTTSSTAGSPRWRTLLVVQQHICVFLTVSPTSHNMVATLVQQPQGLRGCTQSAGDSYCTGVDLAHAVHTYNAPVLSTWTTCSECTQRSHTTTHNNTQQHTTDGWHNCLSCAEEHGCSVRSLHLVVSLVSWLSWEHCQVPCIGQLMT